jgi:hypothetical protein
MTNYNKVFEERQYRAITTKAAAYYMESAKTSDVPLIKTDVPDAKEYTYVPLSDPNVSIGGLEWAEQGKVATTVHNSATIDLHSLMMHIVIDNNDIANFGSQLIADKKAAQIAKFASDVDDSILHGVRPYDGFNTAPVPFAQGLVGQLTGIQNIAGGASNMATKGYIWAGIKYIMDDIPFAMREEGPDMILMMSEKLYANATAPDRVYNDMVEWDFIHRTFMGPEAVHGRKIGKVIVTNKILAAAGDTTLTSTGGAQTTADTVGTHDRMLLYVPDNRWVGRVVSRNFSLVGEESGMLHTHQLYGWRGRGYWFNADCANYTEALVWA